MKKLADVLARALVRNHHRTELMEVRARYGILQAVISIVGNLVLFGIKLAFGITVHSVALVADAAHSLGDLVTSVIVLIGFRVARKPADVRHPYGHGRAEPIGTLIIAILLIIAGVEFAHVSFDRLRDPEPVRASALVIAVLVVAIVFKEWMARLSTEFGRRIESDMLKADAWHHRSDAISTVLVIAAIVGAWRGVYWLDGLLGIGVAVLIAGTGFHLARNMVSRLMGEAPSREIVAQIISAAASVRGVQGVHGVEVHDYGDRQIAVLHVEVAPDLPTGQSHEIARGVEETLRRRLGVAPVVHIDLRQTADQGRDRQEVQHLLAEIIARHGDVAGFHGLQVFEDEHGPYVELHVQLPPQESLDAAHHLGHQVSEELSARLGGVKVNVHVEPTG